VPTDLDSWITNPRPMRLAVQARESRHLDFDYFHRATRRLSGPDRARTFDSMPVADQETVWSRLARRRTDERYAEGLVEFQSIRAERRKRQEAEREKYPRPRRTAAGKKLDHALDRIREIPAEEYLEPVAGVEPLRGGRVACPLPHHEDLHPSASYTGTVWHCHRCAQGGDLLALAAEVSGISTNGREFRELVHWTADRLAIEADR
jgi:hypothetical protein